MRVGCTREIKNHEYRVGLTPGSVREYVAHGHEVVVETGAGAGIGADDAAYRAAGARIAADAAEVFSTCDMIVKVKEPQPQEWVQFREGQILYTYLHLAPDPEQTRGLVESGVTAIAYETVTDERGGLPLLAPMSEVAGRLSAIVGSHYLQKHMGGLGRLMCGVPGVPPAKVLVLGGGVAGFNAAKVAVGMGADVTILEKGHDRMRQLDDYFRGQAKVVYSSADYIEKAVTYSDLIIGAVLVPGASAPMLVTKPMLKTMKPGTVMVDIAIDQGGCFETSRATTHNDPVYTIDGVIHYCVANMPGAVPLTSALALNNAVLPYALALADKGWKKALLEDPNLRRGLNVCKGKITHKGVAESLNLEFVETPKELAA